MALRPLFPRDSHNIIGVLYGAIVAQARLPTFYLDYGVPDTVNGRFDMIVLHAALLLQRLAAESGPARSAGQEIFARFCRDMDHSLREMGVGDLAVPKQMQRVAEAFYGRSRAYQAALTADDDRALAAALARNVLGDSEAAAAAFRLATYVRCAARHLASLDAGAVARGELSFPDPKAVPT